MNSRSILMLVAWVYLSPIYAQTPTTSGPAPSAEVAIYESYRSWKSRLPQTEQDQPGVLERYRDHLLQQGVATAEAERQVRIVRTQGRKLETDRWNRILTAENPRFNTQPNSFLVDRVKGVAPGKALDVGMGQGRNAIYLAQQGWDVTGFDLADKAVAVANAQAQKAGVKINAVVADAEEFDWGTDRWDLIVLSYVPVRENAAHVIQSLRPGGLVIIEGAHVDATRANSISREVVFESNELMQLFPSFRVLHYEDTLGVADFGGKVEARLVRLCAQKAK